MSTAVKTVLAGVPDGRSKKLFPKEWLEIIALAEGGMPVKEIAATYEVDQSIIYKGLRKREVSVTAVAKRLSIEASEKAKSEILDRIRDMKSFDYMALKILQQQIMAVASVNIREKKDHGDSLNAMKALKIAIEGIAKGTEMKRIILGMDKENENADQVLPELPISEMTDVEVDQMRLQQEMEDGMAPGELEALHAGAGISEDEADIELSEVVSEGDEDAF